MFQEINWIFKSWKMLDQKHGNLSSHPFDISILSGRPKIYPVHKSWVLTHVFCMSCKPQQNQSGFESFIKKKNDCKPAQTQRVPFWGCTSICSPLASRMTLDTLPPGIFLPNTRQQHITGLNTPVKLILNRRTVTAILWTTPGNDGSIF